MRGRAFLRIEIAETGALSGMHEMRHIAPVPALRIVEGEFELATQFGTKNGQHAVGGVRDRPRQLCVGGRPALRPEPGRPEQCYGASKKVTTVHLAASRDQDLEGNHYSQVKRLESGAARTSQD